MADSNQDGVVSLEEYLTKAMEIAEKEKQEMEKSAASENENSEQNKNAEEKKDEQ